MLTGIGIGTFVATLARSATPSFSSLARDVLVRGSGVDVAYVQLLVLGVIASVLLGFSAWKFRGQMS